MIRRMGLNEITIYFHSVQQPNNRIKILFFKDMTLFFSNSMSVADLLVMVNISVESSAVRSMYK